MALSVLLVLAFCLPPPLSLRLFFLRSPAFHVAPVLSPAEMRDATGKGGRQRAAPAAAAGGVGARTVRLLSEADVRSGERRRTKILTMLAGKPLPACLPVCQLACLAAGFARPHRFLRSFIACCCFVVRRTPGSGSLLLRRNSSGPGVLFALFILLLDIFVAASHSFCFVLGSVRAQASSRS